MADLKAFLTAKKGPLPMWAWLAVGGVGLGLGYRYYQSKKGAATATTAAGTPTTAADTSASTDSPDISGLGGVPLTGTGGTASGGGVSDTGTGTGTGFSTGPTAPPDGYTFDANGNLVPLSQVQGEDILNYITTLASEGYRMDPTTGLIEPISGAPGAAPATDLPDLSSALPAGGTPAPASSLGAAPAMPAAPPVADIPQNTTSPTAHTAPAKGTVLWVGTATPNLQTIAKANGLPVTALHVTTSGPNTTIGGVTGSRHVVSVI